MKEDFLIREVVSRPKPEQLQRVHVVPTKLEAWVTVIGLFIIIIFLVWLWQTEWIPGFISDLQALE